MALSTGALSTPSEFVVGQSLVTFRTTGSSDCTTVPGGGSILTTVQFAATITIVYLGFAEASVTSVRPSFVSFLRAISAF